MRIVDDDAEGLAFVDSLHAARDPCDCPQRGGRGVQVEVQSGCHAHGRECVVDIEATGQAQAHRAAPIPGLHPHQEAPGQLGQRGRGQVQGARLTSSQVDGQAVAPDSGASGGGDDGSRLALGVIGIDDGVLAPALLRVLLTEGQSREEAALGGPIGLQRAVELQVLGGHVGEHRDIVGDAADATLRQPVRARLDHRPAIAGSQHGGQVVLQFGCLGCAGTGAVAQALASDDDVGRAHQAGAVAGRCEDGANEVGRGRLAVGASDADDAQRPAGITRPPGCRKGQRRPGIAHHQLGHAEAGDRPFHDDGSGSGRRRGRHVVVAIVMLPTPGHEDVTFAHLSRVVAEMADGRIRTRRHAPAMARTPAARAAGAACSGWRDGIQRWSPASITTRRG